ncbi:hypothetical protein [Aneurinibacillus migulanus]|uniref:Uncharacterized protein n=1 Tax=Aneurinibacillus migulanus TaxID=47500 RepID=A0A1G8PJA0_ANEMI|nr:hypothetical protein [Aneurinibacillus migulanus]MED0892851.1 hypothetical protein [Aneurinibacillus migulanus]MED1619097.1 hypothetical protein [Aneurinibacillus migulanus]GED13986.1 hypothetical protein AMI01nite_19770 [Aneurinibacillus migulanus]SDI92611.1 hypothetical protein SAMN04487909_109115 [Aneurinibacillus migulanus]
MSLSSFQRRRRELEAKRKAEQVRELEKKEAPKRKNAKKDEDK